MFSGFPFCISLTILERNSSTKTLRIGSEEESVSYIFIFASKMSKDATFHLPSACCLPKNLEFHFIRISVLKFNVVIK